jgi:phage tail-like protein
VPPRLLTARAISPTTLQLGFDVDVLIPRAAAADIVPETAPAVPVHAVAWSEGGRVAIVTVAPEMTPGARYTALVSGVVDLAGELIAPPDDRATFIGFTPPRPAGRVFDLGSMLPRHARRADATGDLARFTACLQELVDLLLASIDRWPQIVDLERAPESFVDAILADLGNPFELDLDLPARRRLAGSLVAMYRGKGTAVGIAHALRFFLGVEARVLPFAAEGLSLGDAELGVDWILGPSARWARYAFDVEVNRVLTDAERRHLRAVVDLLKPAHTHFVSLIEPGPPPIDDDWVLGVGELGAESVLG